jgi:hypothetical protein
MYDEYDIYHIYDKNLNAGGFSEHDAKNAKLTGRRKIHN